MTMPTRSQRYRQACAIHRATMPDAVREALASCPVTPVSPGPGLADQHTLLMAFGRIALAWGGSCLSLTWPGGRARLWCRCAQGHEWHPLGESLRRGDWCPVCINLPQPVAPEAPPLENGTAAGGQGNDD